MKTYSNDDKIHISISPVRGHYDSMVKRRTWHVIVHLIKKYENLRLAEQTEDKITYHHNQEKNILESLISASTDTPINLTISEVTLTTRIK